MSNMNAEHVQTESIVTLLDDTAAINRNVDVLPAATIASAHKQQQQQQQQQKSKKQRNKCDLGENFIAPDGGWGWLVAFGAGISTMNAFSITQNLGIIFRDYMKSVGIDDTQLTTIINVQIAISAISGFMDGPIFRNFSYRQVALFGAFVLFFSAILLAFANNFLLYLIAYAIGYGWGRGLTLSSSSIAINTYFKENRRQAASYQFTIAACGPIVLPYIATLSVSYFGVLGTAFIFAGIILHNVPCALLYQPVKWHARYRRTTPVAENIAAADCTLLAPNSNTAAVPAERSISYFQRLVDFFDLTLLLDKTYLNLVIGMVTINFVETNFAILLPFILRDFKYDPNQVALAMTVLGICDLITRFLMPILTSKLSFSNKSFFMIGIFGMCLGRVLLTLNSNFYFLILILLWVGLNKALRTIFSFLIIPSYVPLKRLPAANGIQLLMSGIFSFICGPLIGLIKTYYGIIVTLHILNLLCILPLTAWLLVDISNKRNGNTHQTNATAEKTT